MNARRLILLVVVSGLLAACALVPVRPTSGIVRVESPNFDARRPNLIVIHHTSDDEAAVALRTLTSPARKVSSHYLIGRDGTVFQLVDESARAWHAGKSRWGGITDVNSVSLGIELDNNGSEPFADAQIDALLGLLADIRQRYPIPAANIIGHADVAPTRKDDPSAWFPWEKLAEHGFGLWCNGPLAPVPEGFDIGLALTAIGYDPATPDASRRAFRLHFMHGDAEPFEDYENALAYCLVQKKGAPVPKIEPVQPTEPITPDQASWQGSGRAAPGS